WSLQKDASTRLKNRSSSVNTYANGLTADVFRDPPPLIGTSQSTRNGARSAIDAAALGRRPTRLASLTTSPADGVSHTIPASASFSCSAASSITGPTCPEGGCSRAPQVARTRGE